MSGMAVSSDRQKRGGFSAASATSKVVVEIHEKPRRPLSAYNLFFQEERLKLLAPTPMYPGGEHKPSNHKKVGFAEMARLIGAKWKVAHPETLKRLEALAKTEKNRYKKELALWRKLVNQHSNNKNSKGMNQRPQGDSSTFLSQRNDLSRRATSAIPSRVGEDAAISDLSQFSSTTLRSTTDRMNKAKDESTVAIDDFKLPHSYPKNRGQHSRTSYSMSRRVMMNHFMKEIGNSHRPPISFPIPIAPRNTSRPLSQEASGAAQSSSLRCIGFATKASMLGPCLIAVGETAHNDSTALATPSSNRCDDLNPLSVFREDSISGMMMGCQIATSAFEARQQGQFQQESCADAMLSMGLDRLADRLGQELLNDFLDISF